MQFQQAVAFTGICGSASATEDLAESSRRDDQSVVECFQMRRDQTVRFLVVNH